MHLSEEGKLAAICASWGAGHMVAGHCCVMRHPSSTSAESSQRTLDSEDSDSSGEDEGARKDASGRDTNAAPGRRRKSRLQGKGEAICICFGHNTTLSGLACLCLFIFGLSIRGL